MADITRRSFLTAAAASGILPCLEMTARAQRSPRKERLISNKTRSAIQRGLRFLADQQNDDGAFGTTGYRANVAVVSLAGMAFMASGSTPGRGKYGENVSRCVAYLLNNSHKESGFITVSGTATHGPMYGHGFATLFLAEVYGMSPDSQVREKLSKAVKLIIATQNDEGGWRYHPQKQQADISVTICQVMALRAARNAGIFVPNDTIDRCTEYVKRCQTPDGGFSYMGDDGESAFPRSAAGIVALYSAGIYRGEAIDKGLQYLSKHLPRAGGDSRESHFMYGQYYAVQAMWHAGGKHWQKWYPAVRDALLSRQQKGDGAWPDLICPEYGTAMACLILQMPNNYLPIFQK